MLGCCFDLLVIYYAKDLKIFSEENEEANGEVVAPEDKEQHQQLTSGMVKDDLFVQERRKI